MTCWWIGLRGGLEVVGGKERGVMPPRFSAWARSHLLKWESLALDQIWEGRFGCPFWPYHELLSTWNAKKNSRVYGRDYQINWQFLDNVLKANNTEECTWVSYSRQKTLGLAWCSEMVTGWFGISAGIGRWILVVQLSVGRIFHG